MNETRDPRSVEPLKIGGINRLAVLTRVFLQENVWQFLPGGEKKGL